MFEFEFGLWLWGAGVGCELGYGGTGEGRCCEGRGLVVCWQGQWTGKGHLCSSSFSRMDIASCTTESHTLPADISSFNASRD